MLGKASEEPIVSPTGVMTSSPAITDTSRDGVLCSGEHTDRGNIPQHRNVLGERHRTRTRSVLRRSAIWITISWHLTRRNGDPPMNELGDGHGPAHTRQEARNHVSPERRMRKRILVDSVPVYQSTSGLMEEARVHRNTRNIWTKSSLPDAVGNRPRGKNLATFFRAKNVEPPCFSVKCSRQAQTEPFHTAHYSTGQRHS